MRKGHSALSDLFYCVISGGKNGFEQYLKRGGNKNIQCSDGNSILIHSVESSDRLLFDFCLSVDVNLELANMKDNTALHYAAVSSDVYFLKKLLEKDLDFPIDNQDYKGNTALMLSIIKMQPEASIVLLKRGSNPNICNKDGHTALHLLILDNPDSQLLENHSYPLLQTFVEYGADWHIISQVFAGGCTPLMCAVINKDITTVDTILSYINPAIFTKDLFKLFLFKNHCYKEVLLLNGVNPCVNVNNTSVISYLLTSGTGSLNDFHCIVQNYSQATKSTNNELLDYCFGSKTQILPVTLINILVTCGLQLTKHSSFIKLSENLYSELEDTFEHSMCNNAVSLQEQCRSSIRQYLGIGLHEKICVLPVPKSVKKYLLFFNELTCKYSYNVNKFYKHKMIFK